MTVEEMKTLKDYITEETVGLLAQMGKDAFELNFWTLDYRSGFSTLVAVLAKEGLSGLDEVGRFFTRKYEHETAFCHALYDRSSAETAHFEQEDVAGARMLSGDGVVREMVQELDKEAKTRKRYSLALKKEILVPMGQFRGVYSEALESLSGEIYVLLDEYEFGQRKMVQLRSNYRQKARELAKSGPEDVAKDVVLAEEARERRRRELFETEPAKYVIAGGEMEVDKEKLVLVLRELIEKCSHERETRWFPFQRRTLTQVSEGNAVTSTLVSCEIVPLVDSVYKAELFGQFLVDAGFLRNLSVRDGQFGNISEWDFEWTQKALDLAKMEGPVLKTSSLAVDCEDLESSYMWSVVELDRLRSALEEKLFTVFRALNALELQRLTLLQNSLRVYVDQTFRHEYADYNSALNNKDTGRLKSTAQSLKTLKDAIGLMNPKIDARTLVETHKTGGFVSRVETFDGFRGKKVVQLFGNRLSTVIRLENRPIPAVVLALVTRIDALATETLKQTAWWNQGMVDWGSVFALRSKLNNVALLESEFYSPRDGVMSKEARRRSNSQIEEAFGDEKPQNAPEELFVLLNVLRLYFLQLPEGLVPGKYIPKLNSIYGGSEGDRSHELFDAVLSKISDNLSTLNCLVLLWDTLLGSTPSESHEDVLRLLAKVFVDALVRADPDESYQFNQAYGIKFIRDLLSFKEDFSREIEAKVKQRKLSKGKSRSETSERSESL